MAAKRGGGNDKRFLFEQVALPHLDAVYTAALRLARNQDDAKDLLQETILRAYRFFDQFTKGTNCRAWLLTILYNSFRNGYRRAMREQPATSTEDFEQRLEAQSLLADAAHTDPEQMLSGRMLGHQLETALDTLPPEFREALLLVDVQELNYREAAGVLDIPVGTVKSRVSRGRALMREALKRLAQAQGKTGT
jgi:RNA polymerase sigma-70 factor (ECF subfamily)